MPIDIDHLRSWIGREDVAEDVITPVPVAALAATLDRDDPKPRRGDELPPLWHSLYFLPTVRQSELASDGHPKRGGFLPAVPLHAACGPARGSNSIGRCGSENPSSVTPRSRMSPRKTVAWGH